MGDGNGFATRDDIRRAFFGYLNARELRELRYVELWHLLRSDGIKLRGGTPKEERNQVHYALSSSPDIVKVRPGVFAAKELTKPSE